MSDEITPGSDTGKTPPPPKGDEGKAPPPPKGDEGKAPPPPKEPTAEERYVAKLFAAHPSIDILYKTSDGNYFIKETDAEFNVKSKKLADPIITPIKKKQS